MASMEANAKSISSSWKSSRVFVLSEKPYKVTVSGMGFLNSTPTVHEAIKNGLLVYIPFLEKRGLLRVQS
jgi:hypothetical protein